MPTSLLSRRTLLRGAGALVALPYLEAMMPSSALAAPSALALIPANFADGPARTRAVGVYTAVTASGTALGLILGGVLSDWASWRWVLLINVPIAVAVVVIAAVAVRETPRRTGHFDIAGALTSTTGMIALVYGLTRASTDGWGDSVVLTALAGAVALLGTFLVVEARVRQPIVPLRLFTDRARATAFLTMLLFPAAMFGMFFFLTQFLQRPWMRRSGRCRSPRCEA